MITDFRKRNDLTQKKMAEVLGYNKRTIEYYEGRENRGDIKQTLKYIKLCSAMIKYEFNKTAAKIYTDNQSIIDNIPNDDNSPIVIEEYVEYNIDWRKLVVAFIIIIIAIVFVEMYQ